jgi:hypothetical protein
MGGGQCAECQKKRRGVGGKPLQTKLAISEPDDVYEQEADRVGEQVMRMSPADVSRRQNGKTTHPLVQRRASAGAATGVAEAPPIVHDVLNSPGQPLDAATRAFFEPRFGYDFSHVRVHAGSKAAESSHAVNAHAYTVGNDIVFSESYFRLDSSEGRKLLAHELTHVMQQSDSMDGGNRENRNRHYQPATVLQMKHAKGSVRLQRQAKQNQNNGGCGICTSPPVAGTLAHTLAEFMFALTYGRRQIMPETPFVNPADMENGRLDLMRIVKSSTPPTIIEIGEIKPDNDKGRMDGKRDLEFYKNAVQAIFPGPLFEVAFMDLPAPAVSVPFTDAPPASQCPFQEFSVRNTKLGGQPGLYLYSCTPLGSQINKSCCGTSIPITVPKTSDADDKAKNEKPIQTPTNRPVLQPSVAKSFERQILDFIHDVIVSGKDVEQAVRQFLNDHREIVENIELIVAAIAAGAILADILSAGAATAKDPVVAAILMAMVRIARVMRLAVP